MKRPFHIFKSFRAQLAAAFIVAMLFAGATSNFLIYRYAFDAQFEQLRDKLKTIAQMAALSIDPRTLALVPLDKEGARTAAYSTITRKLARIKQAVPSITYLYILTRSDKEGVLRFVVDLETAADTEEDAAATPGDPYDASRFPEMMASFNGATADRKIAADRWGVFLSGYAPIRDTNNKAIAILGVDMKAEDVYNAQQEVRRRALLVFGLGLILSVAFAVFISGRVTGKIKALTEGTRRIAQGDLDYQVKIRGEDEIARLALFFNKMSSDLKNHIEELKRTTADKERLLRELEIAHGIQQSFLPESAPVIPGVDIAAVSLPARVVGGDFYDFIPIDSERWGLVVADVSGKGVPAALFMALSRTLVRASAAGNILPSDAVNHANMLILRDSKTDMFVTLFYAVLEGATKVLKYANAGHNPPLVVSADTNDIVLLKAQGVPLGIMSDIAMTTEEITLKAGDIAVLYTDGVTEAVNTDREQFELERLADIIKANRTLSAQELITKIRQELTDFVGDQPQFDDITVMVLKAV